jgi:hypothetical protein
MSNTRCWHLTFLTLWSSLSPIPLAHSSTAPDPQIVRISYVQGDVRVSRGKDNEKATGSTWETAAANLPVEGGFNLVTGTGRAEIEFEDTSTVYLGENSVLAFNGLYTHGSVPYTEIALLSGTATLHVHLATDGELFVLKTPTNAITLTYPDDSFVRVNSYLDGMTVTPQEKMIAHLEGVTEELAQGRTTSYNVNGRIRSDAPVYGESFTEWDNWVANRVASRSAAMTAVMRASGLSSPIPGLADMNGQGTFFPCAPYGTCWEPKNLPDQPSGAEVPDAQQISAALPQQSAQANQVAATAATGLFERDFFFPCPPTRIRSWITRDPVTGRERVLSSMTDVGTDPYDWAVCHAGSWIYRQHRYVWVAGTKKHHHCPVRWVRTGHSVAYVPIHPHDVLGKPPMNRVHGVFALSGKQGDHVEPISLDSSSEVKVLKTVPKEFRNAYFTPLSRAAEPMLDAHRMGDKLSGFKQGFREPGVRISFDHKSQSFMLAKQDLGGRSTAGLEAFNGRMGNIQGHVAGFSGSGRSFGGGASGGSGRSSAGVSSGGGFHGGGTSGGVGSGGASHGGGGGHP